MANINRRRELNTNWLGPSTVLPDKTDAKEGQPELINPTANLDPLGLDRIGYLPGKDRPQLRFAVKSERNAPIGAPEKTTD